MRRAEHGCLAVVPRSHRDGLLTHCPAAELGPSIPDHLLRLSEMVPLPMQRGDVLLLHRLTCHRSLSNVSDRYPLEALTCVTIRSASPQVAASSPALSRSRSDPAGELHSPEVWAELWYEGPRRKLGRENAHAPFDRWGRQSGRLRSSRSRFPRFWSVHFSNTWPSVRFGFPHNRRPCLGGTVRVRSH